MITLSAAENERKEIKITKCCEDGKILNSHYDCVPASGDFHHPIENVIIEVDSGPMKLLVTDHRQPSCNETFEHHKVSQTQITVNGGAKFTKYKETFNREKVCFDALENLSGLVALICDPCKLKTCLNLCCPFKEAYKDDLENKIGNIHRCDPEPGTRKKCQLHDEQLVWNGSWWHQESVVDMEEDKDYIFISSSQSGASFQCADGKSLVPTEFLFGPNDIRLQKNGVLNVLQNLTAANVFNSSEFCLSFADIPEYDDYYSDEEANISDPSSAKIRPLFSVCYGEEAEKGQVFTGIFYPTAIFISCFFVLFTIITYAILQDLRSNLFGKITLGFLINVFVCYFFLGVHYSMDLEGNKDFLNTGFCVFLGYITHHTFISFFFWMSAMAVNITRKFSNILVSTNEESTKSLILNILYAQGIPSLITLAVALMDSYGPCDAILPNMGRYSCFLGSQQDSLNSFFSVPEFLYFYLIIIIVVISNFICFVITGYFLITHWSTVKNIQTRYVMNT